MNHPYEKLIRIVIISIVFALISGVIGVIKGYTILIFLSLYFLAISLLFEAVLLFTTFRQAEGGLQFLRAILLLLFTSFLFFQL
ncbi:hypothetical protein ACLIBH_01540 [Virgibacillus sp. W0430]|uniref:hypothetical protein n=1 Tax=Virgibacillus sp. W0430 TaxID=3391580 RepID=UPI003F464891